MGTAAVALFYRRRRIIWILVVLGCALTAAIAADAAEQGDNLPKKAFQCASCGKGVQRGYLQAMGKVWHPEHFVCGVCAENLLGATFIPHQGRPYHRQCYLDHYAPRCGGCDTPIEGRYLTALERKWHPHHFACVTCQRPIVGSRFVAEDGQPYHEACAAKTFNPRCEICLAPVTDHYLTNFWEEAFCQHHNEQLQQCYGCGRLISEHLTDGGVHFDDGRTLCNLCRRTGVDSLRTAAALARKVTTELANLGFALSPASFPLRLVDQRELTQSGSHGERINGTTQLAIETRDGQVVKREIAAILMLHGMPAAAFAATYAHELGHVWLFQQHFPELPLHVEEGICELFAHLWLTSNPGPWSDYLIHLKASSTDPIYGEGYRIALRSMEQMKPAALFEYVKNHHGFPPSPPAAPDSLSR